MPTQRELADQLERRKATVREMGGKERLRNSSSTFSRCVSNGRVSPGLVNTSEMRTCRAKARSMILEMRARSCGAMSFTPSGS